MSGADDVTEVLHLNFGVEQHGFHIREVLKMSNVKIVTRAEDAEAWRAYGADVRTFDTPYGFVKWTQERDWSK